MLCTVLCCRGNKKAISKAVAELGIETQYNNVELRTRMAYDMFDTLGKVRLRVRGVFDCK